MLHSLLPLLLDYPGYPFAPVVPPPPPDPGGGGDTPLGPHAVGGDLSRIETGPCKVTYKGIECGHTIGGAIFSAKPQLRERKVDEYGEHLVELVHTGDTSEIKTTMVEKILTAVQTVYQFGVLLSPTVWGIGRRPGGRSRTSAGELILHPLDADDVTTDDVVIYQAAVIDNGELQFGSINQDRVLECVWRALVDESRDDGNVLGRMGVGTS